MKARRDKNIIIGEGSATVPVNPSSSTPSYRLHVTPGESPPHEQAIWRIACFWQKTAVIFVGADTLEDAIEELETDHELPTGRYVEDSFEVDRQQTEELNDPDPL